MIKSVVILPDTETINYHGILYRKLQLFNKARTALVVIPGYWVSFCGRILRACKKTGKLIPMWKDRGSPQSPQSPGVEYRATGTGKYPTVALMMDYPMKLVLGFGSRAGRQIQVDSFVHVAVACSWVVNESPCDRIQVHHVKEPLCFHGSNLMWVTPKENTNEMFSRRSKGFLEPPSYRCGSRGWEPAVISHWDGGTCQTQPLWNHSGRLFMLAHPDGLLKWPDNTEVSQRIRQCKHGRHPRIQTHAYLREKPVSCSCSKPRTSKAGLFKVDVNRAAIINATFNFNPSHLPAFKQLRITRTFTDHRNNNSMDDRAKNLQWVTSKENFQRTAPCPTVDLATLKGGSCHT